MVWEPTACFISLNIWARLTGDPTWNISIPKAQWMMNLLTRKMYSCSSDTKELAYKTLVRPVLEYTSSAWDPHLSNHIQHLENVQRRAARFVSGQHDRTVLVTNIMASLGWRSLQSGTQIGFTYQYVLQESKRSIRLQHPSLHPTAFYTLTSQPWPTIQSPTYHQPQWCIHIHFSQEPSEYGIYCQLFL